MLLRLILHEITGSLHGFLHRFHITTLDPENSGFTRLLSEAFTVSEHPPDKGVSSEEGRASDDAGLRKGVRPKMNQSITLPGSRCRALHHASWISVASEEGTVKSWRAPGIFVEQ